MTQAVQFLLSKVPAIFHAFLEEGISSSTEEQKGVLERSFGFGEIFGSPIGL